ncbi:L,D-transpeptidase family protein [Sphingomonas sp. 37zxx]|uniref:L,D-transpeptidase family protein n=1 Tax=Sphingomonas sp. 37zxx TaxID=1550073 RepID=UPI001E51357B|nr:L,D-transpeptidase family protein [Sphingomonas sp. 37zxx]
MVGLGGSAVLAAAAVSLMPVGAATAQVTAQPVAAVDASTLHVQVILDKLGFGPGVLDGKGGQSLTAALRGFQTSRGLPVTGKADRATLKLLGRYRNWRPTKVIALTPGMLAGPFMPNPPKGYAEQAKLPGIPYRSPLEKLAEMFHTTPETLVALNSRQTPLKVGQEVIFPNALPTSRDYDVDDEGWRRTLAYLNVDARQPVAERVVVDESEGVLKVYDASDRLVAQFSATMGSSQFPLPIGTWTIKGVARNPDWSFDPKLIAGTAPDAKEAIVPPGPNNPVGIVWIDLSKEHYGIHGTPEPANIGRTESNGCIRLMNWDAARVSMMVKPGTKAVFQR